MAKQTIGEFLATLRKANGYTQQEVADRLGISNRTLSGWECNNVLPDILLLPALAELYGVTVDEILAGERLIREDKVISLKAEKNIYRGKLSKFSLQAWILTGLCIIGLFVAFFAGYGELVEFFDFEEATVYMMISGIVVGALCFGLLFVFWNHAEESADDSVEFYPSYCIALRKKLVTCLLAITIWTVFQAIIAFYSANFEASDGMYVNRVAIVSACFLFPAVILICSCVLYKRAIIKYDVKYNQYLHSDKKYFFAVALFGLIPLTIATIVSVILFCIPSVSIENLYIIYVDVAVLAVDAMVCFGLCIKRRFGHYPKF